jgi:hypothetical protein
MFGRVAEEAVRRFHECLLGVYAVSAGTFVLKRMSPAAGSEPRSGETKFNSYIARPPVGTKF